MNFKLRIPLFAALLAALVAAVTAAPASARPELVFSAQTSEPSGEQQQIVTFDPTSRTFATVLKTGPQFRTLADAVWNRAGDRIAFVGEVASNVGGAAAAPREELWTATLEGGQLKRISQADLQTAPVFSPDGKRVAFVALFPRRSGAGCARGGYAVSVATVASATTKRASACFKSTLARSGVAFLKDGRSVAAVVDRKRVVRLAARGGHARRTKPPVIHTAARGDRIAIESYVPGADAIWLRFDTGDSELLRLKTRKSALLPDATYAVAPNGRVSTGNCAPLPERGLCATSLRTRKRTQLASIFEPDLSRDSLEFGFAFDGTSSRLVTFGHPAFGLDGLPSSTKICTRASLVAAPICDDLPSGIRIADRQGAVAFWRPTAIGSATGA